MKQAASNELVTELLPFYGELYSFLKGRVRCPEEAADLTQQAYLRVIRWRREGAEAIDHHRGVLYRIARNLLIDRSRRKRRRIEEAVSMDDAEPQEAASPVTPADVAEARDQMAEVRRAISELPERCREVFVLNRFGHLSYGEIAERLQISRSTVEKHMIKAISACKQALETAA